MRNYKLTIGCNGAIFKNKSVLLILRNDYDVWSMPGGGLERGETLKECVRREVFEETGYEVSVKRLVGIYEKPIKDDMVFVFECEIVGGKAKINSEARDIQFFPIDALPENITDNARERIRDAHEAKEVIHKVQIPTDRGKLKKL